MRVLIVDRYSARSSSLRAVVESAGFSVVDVVSEDSDLYAAIERLAPDAIIVGADSPSRDVLEDVATLGREFPKPMLMLSSREDRRLMAQASDAGIAAYVLEGLSPALVRSLVEVAVSQFRQVETLRRELAETREALADRQVIDRAKCLLMEHEGLGEQAAYKRLRQSAMDRALPLVEVARQVMMRAAGA